MPTIQYESTVVRSSLPRTDRECSVCEEGNYLKQGSELICERCQHSPIGGEPAVSLEHPWESFWDHREEYSGHYGSGRKRCVGGFLGAYGDDGIY